MKRIFIIGVFILFDLYSFCQSKKIQDIIGRWTVADGKNPGAGLEIVDSTDIVITYMGEQKRILDYKFDFSKSPVWFDFSVRDTSSVLKVKSIMEIVNDSLIKWQLFVDEERPDHFSMDKGELFYLVRTKTNSNSASLSKREQ